MYQVLDWKGNSMSSCPLSLREAEDLKYDLTHELESRGPYRIEVHIHVGIRSMWHHALSGRGKRAYHAEFTPGQW